MTGFTILTVQPTEDNWAEMCAKFIKTHSWGEDFPYDPRDLLLKSEYLVVAVAKDDDLLLGMACVTRHQGAPDDYEDTNPFFCCWAVHTDHRRQWIGRKLYAEAIAEAKGRQYPEIFATTDSKESTRILVHLPLSIGEKYSWVAVRPGLNEDKTPFVMLALYLGA